MTAKEYEAACEKAKAQAVALVEEVLAAPIAEMANLGAFPSIVLAETEDGVLFVLLTQTMDAAAVVKLLESAVAALTTGRDVTFLYHQGALGGKPCGCLRCVMRRASATPPEKPIPSPADPGVH